jgi:predicted Zn finger-like uncharacterized protein
MIEVQCTSCQTRYRIDERILPDETPTFKCSRCGHVFTIEPRKRAPRRAGAEGARAGAAAVKPPPAAAKPGAVADAPVAGADAADAAAARAAESRRAAEAAAPSPAAQPAADADAAAAPPTEPPRPRPTLRRAPSAAAARQAAQSASLAQTPPAPARDAVQGAAPSQGAPPSEPAAEAAQAAGARIAQASSPASPHSSGADAADKGFVANDASEEPAPQRSPTEELLRRRFEQPADEATRPGGNLSFDFSDEVREPVGASDLGTKRYGEEEWEVGESAAAPSTTPRAPRRIRTTDIDDAREGQDFEQLSHEEASAAAQRLEAELRGRAYTLHSAGFFIALFALLVFGFGVLSLVICGAPIASAELLSTLPVVGASLEPPISPARRVALTQVHARYTKIKEKQTALIISGTAENVSSATLSTVQIEAALSGPTQQILRSQAVYCGNNLSLAMVGEMTPHELEFFEKLEGPRNFTLAPQASAPFVIVFVAPPAGASRFQLRVAKAEPAAAAASASSGG